MTAYTAQPVSPRDYELGEGPVWDAQRQRLLWVDIPAGTVYAARLDPFAVTGSWAFDGTVGAVAVSAAGDLLVAERETLTHVDTAGRRRQLARVLPPGAPSRLNDGAVDPAGRFLVGSMALDDRRGAEVLVRLDGESLTVLDTDLTVSNGLTWSPNGRRFYSVDSVPGVVRIRDYPSGPREDLFEVTDGVPDGMCADAAGNLWIAVYGGGRVECRSPAGELLATVAVAVPNTTSCAFAGPGRLVITTAGPLFTARVDAVGPPPTYWKPLL